MLDNDLTRRAQRVADTVLDGLGANGCVLVATADGFDLARAGHRAVDAPRLAAMVSAMAALGDAASRETGIGHTRCLVIDSSLGRLVVRCMQHAGQALIVVVLTDASVLLGLVWHQLVAAEPLLAAP